MPRCQPLPAVRSGARTAQILCFFGHFTQKYLNFLEIQSAVHPSLSKSFLNKPLKFSAINTQSTTLPPATAMRPMSRPPLAARREASPAPAQAHWREREGTAGVEEHRPRRRRARSSTAAMARSGPPAQRRRQPWPARDGASLVPPPSLAGAALLLPPSFAGASGGDGWPLPPGSRRPRREQDASVAAPSALERARGACTAAAANPAWAWGSGEPAPARRAQAALQAAKGVSGGSTRCLRQTSSAALRVL